MKITRIEPKQHERDGKKTTVYWVKLLNPDGSVVRAIGTATMTDAVILSERLEAMVKAWAERIGYEAQRTDAQADWGRNQHA